MVRKRKRIERMKSRTRRRKGTKKLKCRSARLPFAAFRLCSSGLEIAPRAVRVR